MIPPTLTPAQVKAIAERFPHSTVIATGMRAEAWIQPGSVWVGEVGAPAGIVLRPNGTEDKS